MTSKERDLLLKDLCARLPYEVQGISSEGVVSPLLIRGEADWDILTSLNYRIVKHGWKPYLRPMSSMTEEEKVEFEKTFDSVYDYIPEVDDYDDNWHDEPGIESYDWINKKMFDYRGLIEKGLAIEAPEDIYNTKTEKDEDSAI